MFISCEGSLTPGARHQSHTTMAGPWSLSLLVLYVTVASSSEPLTFYSLPGVAHKSYSRPGDINVGALLTVQGSTARACHEDTIILASTVEQTEAVAFAVDYINRSPDILPNVSFGFIARGICKALGPTLATSLLYIPQTKIGPYGNGTSYSNHTTGEQASRWLGYDVIGILSTGWSSLTKPISSLYAVADLPVIGATETSNDLSKKSDYPTFFRIIPPQKYKVDLILKFISKMGWSYISIVYTACGGSLADVIKRMPRYGICSATTHHMNSLSDSEDVVTDLQMNAKARVVLALVSNTYFRKLLGSTANRNLTGHFIWLGTNLFDSYQGTETEERLASDPGVGTFFFDAYSKAIPQFFEHLKNVNVYTTNNPWVKPVWENYLNCSVDEKTCDPNENILQSSKYRTYKGSPLRVDAILTLAQAAHDLLSERCPEARGKEARACIQSDLLQEYLRNVRLDGFVAPIQFDKNQDVKGIYSIKQIVYDYPTYSYMPNIEVGNKIIFGKEIGIYDISTDTFSFHEGTISWSHLNTLDSPPIDIPESVCSRPCLPGEYKIEKKVSCCWECRTCRENERFINANTSCEACPSFTWPDPASGFTTCTDLPLTYSTLPDTIPLVLTSLAILALILTVAISVIYVIYRNEKVIKASSRELSVLQLVAIFAGYSTIALFQTVPSDIMCGVIFFMFCMSFAMLYCPLLAKTSRIFRIFKSGAKNERPRFISPQSQLLFTAFLLTIQIALCVATYIMFTPKAVKIQPVWTEKLVELSCDLTLPGLASFLGYNIVLVSVCSVFAFLTRTLPGNFNESKFISMCVSTTLLIWLAFIPTYFTASRDFVRVFLLSVALLLNHSVALIFLFVPKIYAAVFMPDTTGHVTKKAVQ